MTDFTLTEVAAAIAARRMSAEEVTRACLDRIAKLDGRLHTFITLDADGALAYTLVLFAFRISKTGYVVASRELSIVLSAVIGSLWLREGRLGPRLAGASIVLAGVACIALAR